MEKCVIKPRYESYWQGGRPQLHRTHPRFQGSHGTRPLHRPLGLPALGRSDGRGRGQVRQDLQSQAHARQNAPSLPPLLQPPPAAQPGRGHDSTKNRLAIKQYIRDKPVRWGIKSFLLCEAKTGYILDAEIYTGRVRDRHWPLLGSSGSVVRRLVENSQVTNKNHMLFMDRFYNSVALFHMLKKELGVLAAGTVMPSRKHYPKELGRRLTETWPVRIPVPGSSVCHRLEGPQAHPLPEQLPRPEESVHREQACGGPARAVDRATACGGLHQVSLPPVSFHTVLHECSACGCSNFDSRFRYMEPWTRTTRSHA